PHDVREKLVRSSATPGCLIPSVMGFVEQGQGQFPLTSLSICGVLLLGLHVRLPRLLGGAIGFIARISYSMYLSNIAVLLVMIRLLGFGESTYDKLLRISIFFGLVIIVSTITYYLIEKSFLRMRDRFFPAGRTLQTA
ncbi:hypothetical protein ACQKFX_21890, partial [Cupriavidus metallidurans]|uniref:hypothetical protein n=1 Tax=Cupriavidus metallidurans TaxID=119219 RepID=UPI003CFE6EA9